MIVVLFIIGKLAVYTVWCRYGIHLLAPTRKNAWTIAIGLAFGRILLGLALGLGWTFALTYLAPSELYSRLGFDPVPFIIGFLLLRLLQWSTISVLIKMGTGKVSFLRAGLAEWLWRLGGVGLSFAGDAFGLILYIGVVGVIC